MRANKARDLRSSVATHHQRIRHNLADAFCQAQKLPWLYSAYLVRMNLRNAHSIINVLSMLLSPMFHSVQAHEHRIV